LMRASLVVKRHCTVDAVALRPVYHAPTSRRIVGRSGMLRLRHCRVRAFNSISAMLSQLPCLGV